MRYMTQSRRPNRTILVFIFILIWCLGMDLQADTQPSLTPISTTDITNTVTGDDKNIQTALHILDYVSVDYPGVIHNGKVVNKEEYNEQLEFAQQLTAIVKLFPAGADANTKAQIIQQANALNDAIKKQSSPEQVTDLCAALSTHLIDVTM